MIPLFASAVSNQPNNKQSDFNLFIRLRLYADQLKGLMNSLQGSIKHEFLCIFHNNNFIFFKLFSQFFHALFDFIFHTRNLPIFFKPNDRMKN